MSFARLIYAYLFISSTIVNVSTKPLASSNSLLVEYSLENFTTASRLWEQDMAVMFYAPWCKYCKQLTPYMSQIAYETRENKDLVVGKFNCEEPRTHAEICRQLDVTHYPTIMFLGYGNFHQAPKGNFFGKTKFPRLVKYQADLVPDAIYDWVLMLTGLSWLHRKWDDFIGILNPSKSRTQKAIKILKYDISALNKKLLLQKQKLDKFEADQVFDSLQEKSDPFPLLNSMPPDEKNRPLRLCVTEMAEEYCMYHLEDEPFCAIISANNCTAKEFRPEVCRPASCPFTSSRGRKAVSICTDTAVIKKYIEAIEGISTSTSAGTTGTGTASTGSNSALSGQKGFKSNS